MNESELHVKQLKQLFRSQKQYAVYSKLVSMSKGFLTVNWKESIRIAEKYKCVRSYCHDNCIKVAKKERDLTYYTGTASAIIPIDHSWLVSLNGEVIDPTWCLLLNDHKGIKHTYSYFGIPVASKYWVRVSEVEPLWLHPVLDSMKKGGDYYGRRTETGT